MKRLFLITSLLLLLGTAYADGPRYRFKSRRALQNLWQNNEISENHSFYKSHSARDLNANERNGLGIKSQNDRLTYGVVVENPFTGYKLGRGDNDRESSTFPFDKRTDGGEHLKPGIQLDTINPHIGGNVDDPSGQGYIAPPYPPVGDGLPILLILSATLIAIKKRLSSRG